MSNKSSIDDLLKEHDTKEFTKDDFDKEKAELEKLFLERYGIKPEDIDSTIRNFVLPCNNSLVVRWVENEILGPYLD